MKNLYKIAGRRLGRTLLVAGLMAGQNAGAQSIPDVQWSRPGTDAAVVSDGNVVVANGTQLVKYDSQGNQLWGVSTVAPPFVSPRTIRIAATASGGVVAILAGTVFGAGQGPTALIFRLYDAMGVVGSNASETDATTTSYNGLLGTPDGGFLVLSFTGTSTTVVRKYDRSAQLAWTKTVAYSGPNASLTGTTRGLAAINAPDGYVLAGSYAADATSAPNQTVGWVAKLDLQGNVVWQKLLQNFSVPSVNDSEVAIALRSAFMITDVIPAADGNGYALSGTGTGFAARVTAPTQTILVEITPEGNIRRSRLTDAAPSPTYLTRYTGRDGNRYYGIGNTSTADYLAPGATYQVLSIRADLPGNLPSSLPVVAQRTFSPFAAPLTRLATAGDGGLVLTGAGGVVKLLTEQPTQSLLIGTPAYNCQTGELVVTVSGGTGGLLEYQIRGLRAWSSNNVFTVPSYQRLGTTFTIEVRQNGQVITLPYTANCVTVPNGQFTLRLPNFNCQTGDLTLFYSNGDGSAVDYRVAGLRDWGPSPTFTVPIYQRNGTTFTLQARTASGKSTELPFTVSCPASPLPTNTAVGFGLPDLDCTNGRLLVTTVGGDNTPFEFKVPGLGDWGSSALFTVPVYQRSGTTFTLYLRQSGREYATNFTANCPLPLRLGAPEPAVPLQAVVYPNPVGEQFTVEVQGAAGQSVEFLLIDLYGRQVQRRQVIVDGERHQERFTAPPAVGGLFLLRVATPEQRVTVKVLKNGL